MLSEIEIAQKLPRLKGWEKTGNSIQKKYKFKDFVESMGLVTRVALLAEEENHHPDILINYSRVTLTLTTHSAGGLTEKDFKLASRIDQL